MGQGLCCGRVRKKIRTALHFLRRLLQPLCCFALFWFVCGLSRGGPISASPPLPQPALRSNRNGWVGRWGWVQHLPVVSRKDIVAQQSGSPRAYRCWGLQHSSVTTTGYQVPSFVMTESRPWSFNDHSIRSVVCAADACLRTGMAQLIGRGASLPLCPGPSPLLLGTKGWQVMRRGQGRGGGCHEAALW